MTAKNMTVAQVVEVLKQYDEEMLAIIVFLESATLGIHHRVKYNRMRFSDKDQTLQFAHDVDMPAYPENRDMDVGNLLIYLKRMLATAKKPFEAPEYLVCMREYGSQTEWDNPEKTMYLKNIAPKGAFHTNSFDNEDTDNAIFLEFKK